MPGEVRLPGRGRSMDWKTFLRPKGLMRTIGAIRCAVSRPHRRHGILDTRALAHPGAQEFGERFRLPAQSIEHRCLAVGRIQDHQPLVARRAEYLDRDQVADGVMPPEGDDGRRGVRQAEQRLAHVCVGPSLGFEAGLVAACTPRSPGRSAIGSRRTRAPPCRRRSLRWPCGMPVAAERSPIGRRREKGSDRIHRQQCVLAARPGQARSVANRPLASRFRRQRPGDRSRRPLATSTRPASRRAPAPRARPGVGRRSRAGRWERRRERRRGPGSRASPGRWRALVGPWPHTAPGVARRARPRRSVGWTRRRRAPADAWRPYGPRPRARSG